MDNKPAMIKLPFWETVRRSFMYVLMNLNIYVKVSLLGFAIIIFDMFTGFPSLCHINAENCSGTWQQNVSIILMSLVSIAVVIAYCRAVILKAPVDFFSLSFLRKEIFYLFYSLLLLAIITLPSILVIFAFAFLGQTLHLPDTAFVVAAVIPVGFTIYFSRLFLVFPAIAVDNKEIGLKASFYITKGNANKIFWGQFLLMIPAAAALIIIALIYRLVGSDNYLLNLLFVALIMALSFLDSCFKASFFAHIYQYFTYYQKQQNKAE